ncbi:hypothetical protein ABZY36_37615 [Streptomyces sp. NPDC006627]|uniref:hypothetical protein n=1 Tax=Streptomyces sp. NPDC006627 TaxID=3154679 RepID=UPI00339DAD5C
MALSPGLIGSVACGTIAVFAASLCSMPILAVPLRGLAPELVGVGSAVIVFGGQVAGMVAPPVLGLIADAVSFEAAFAVLALGPLVAAVLALVTPQDTESFTAALPRRGSHALIEKEPTCPPRPPLSSPAWTATRRACWTSTVTCTPIPSCRTPTASRTRSP